MLNTDAAQYRRYWAGLTGKNESEIYVPAALRDPEPEPDGPAIDNPFGTTGDTWDV